MVAHIFNLSTKEAEAGGVSEFEASTVYRTKFQYSLKKTKNSKRAGAISIVHGL